jgi:uncharacterized protein YdhG (YjbR/CyaY superfamily)
MMTFAELIDAADADGAAALREILRLARAASPEAEEGVSYGVAALMHQGKPFIGIGTNARGYALFPFSGSVMSVVADDLADWRVTKGSVSFDSAKPLPSQVVERIIGLRLAEIAQRK